MHGEPVKGIQPHIALRPPAWATEADSVREILREYAFSLALDLGFQNFENELAALPGAYAPPAGQLLLAIVGGSLAACGGYRALDDCEPGACEMKRLFVRPGFRGLGLGRRIAMALLEQARGAGYRSMFLDTLPDMESAQQLYASLGFVDVPAYRFNPTPGTRYLRVDLAPGGT